MSSQRRPSRPVLLLGKMLLFAQDRLSKAIGQRRAEEIIRSAISHFGERSMETPEDLLELARFLLRAGGLIKSVGESLKAQALLRGATDRQA